MVLRHSNMRTTTLGISGLDGLGGPLSFWASCYLLIGRHSLTKVGCLPFLSWNVVEILAISLAADSKTLSIKKKKKESIPLISSFGP